jgi:hypothetical protein
MAQDPSAPPFPGGGFAQKVGLATDLLLFNSLNLTVLLPILNFWAKPPVGEGEKHENRRMPEKTYP